MLKVFTDQTNFSSNVYVFTKKNSAIIVDSGYYGLDVKDYLKNLNLKAILLTHGHYDHIMCLDQIKKEYGDIKVYIHKNDYDFLTTPQLNLSLNNKKIVKIKSSVIPLEDGEYMIDDIKFKLINTPGHTKGSSLFYLPDDNILFTGDTIFVDSIGRTDLITGSNKDMYDSLQKIKSYAFKDDILICPGHGMSAVYKKVKEINIYLS